MSSEDKRLRTVIEHQRLVIDRMTSNSVVREAEIARLRTAVADCAGVLEDVDSATDNYEVLHRRTHDEVKDARRQALSALATTEDEVYRRIHGETGEEKGRIEA